VVFISVPIGECQNIFKLRERKLPFLKKERKKERKNE
jgi:hypothetical protein